MHENLLSHAVVPQRFTVLRLPLMPYSLGNELMMQREENPLLLLSRKEFDELSQVKQCYSLIRAVNICCVRPPKVFWWWSWRNKREDFALAVAEFRNYLDAGRLEFRAQLPKSDDTEVRYIGAPEILRLYAFISKAIPREEIAIWGKSAWDFPLGFARMLYQAHAEERGTLEIYNYKMQVEENYANASEDARMAWIEAATDDEKRAALEKHPMIRELPALADSLLAWEAKQAKGTPCPA